MESGKVAAKTANLGIERPSRKVKRWTEEPRSGQPLSFEGPLASGQTNLLNPGDRLTFDYSEQPALSWKALQ